MSLEATTSEQDGFDQAFDGFEPNPALRKLSEAFCRQFQILDESAPMYITTLAAKELDMGDGGIRFWPPQRPATPAVIERLACKLMHHFWGSIREVAPKTRLADIAGLVVEAIPA